MESFVSLGTDSEMATRVTELIWDQAVLNFGITDNEILLPLNITGIIGSFNVERLKSQLTSFLGRPCVAFVDNSLGCVRILACPEFKGLGSATDNMVLPRISTEGSITLDGCSINSLETVDNKAEKRLKVPRPPNAFILYRKHHHAILKQKYPRMHNNEISVKVGEQWNNESPEVKAHYKALADEAKCQHAQKYPNYQYAPRKPGEKKRRNSRRATANSDFEASSEDEEESSVHSPCESPANSSTSTRFSGQYQDGFTGQTTKEFKTLVPVVVPLNETHRFSDFDLVDYSQWVGDANMSQRMATIYHMNAQNGVYTHLIPPA